jgi:hypothetical protein
VNSCCVAPRPSTARSARWLIIPRGGSGILISQKCQEDPTSRDERKTELWARKNVKGAARQLCGALRAGPRLIWCDHPRRGRVEFPGGLPPITHGLVLTEVFQPIDLQPEADDLPLSCGSTPITYLSVNDFLNLAVDLRTVAELITYLDARRGLPTVDLRRIGSEQPLFEFYLLGDGSLAGCAGISGARLPWPSGRIVWPRRGRARKRSTSTADCLNMSPTRWPRVIGRREPAGRMGRTLRSRSEPEELLSIAGNHRRPTAAGTCAAGPSV